MPTLKTVWQLIQQGDYAFSIDLQDAYLHVPIVKHHRQFLRFVWHNVPYQWRVLPFGLATAPRVFTSLTKPILFLCHCKGLRIVIYLDDILVLVRSKRAGKRACLFLCSLLVCLGLHINFSKSDLRLSQSFTFLGLCWDTVHMSVSLPPDKLADIQQLALSLLHTPHVTVHKVMSFLGKANFCINGHSQLRQLCRVIQSDMLRVYHSPTHLFSRVHFSPSSLRQLDQLAKLQQSPVPLQFPLPDVVIATDATLIHWAFYFQGSGLPLSVSGTWSGSLSRAHIALQELQAVAVMLRRMAFCLSGKVVALHLDNSTAKAYLCNQGGTVSPFLSRLACRIPSLTDKNGITLLPAYIPTHLNVEAGFLSRGRLLPEWHLLPQVAQAAFCLWGLPEVDLLASSRSTQCQHYFTLETPLPAGGLGIECLQPSLEISGKLRVSSSSSGPSCSGQVSSRKCQRSTQTFTSGGSMLDGGSLASHSSQHAGRHSSMVSHHKRSCHGCLGRPGTQGSVVSAFNPLAAQRCVLCQQGFSSSVCQAVAGATRTSTSRVYQQCWKEWAGWCARQGLPNNAISAPKLANFLLHLFQVGLAWHTIGIYRSAISAFLEPHRIHKASNHPVISKLMHHFYLQRPPSQ